MSARAESVLIVENDESLAQIIALALNAAGFETQTAHDGVDGYTSYSRHPTDWVVTDIEMPQLDGIGMMQCIRTVNPRVRAVYLSGAVDEYRVTLEREITQHAAAVLHKPFSRSSLVKELTSTASAVSSNKPKKIRKHASREA
jgi:CheY-like chemotaxis protein